MILRFLIVRLGTAKDDGLDKTWFTILKQAEMNKVLQSYATLHFLSSLPSLFNAFKNKITKSSAILSSRQTLWQAVRYLQTSRLHQNARSCFFPGKIWRSVVVIERRILTVLTEEAHTPGPENVYVREAWSCDLHHSALMPGCIIRLDSIQPQEVVMSHTHTHTLTHSHTESLKKNLLLKLVVSQPRRGLFEDFKSLKSSSGPVLGDRDPIRNLLSSTTTFGRHKDGPSFDIVRAISGK